MSKHIDFNRLRTSWTKYDIVQVMEVVFSIQTIEKFKRKEAEIDEPILRSFLGIKSLNDPIPSYWIEIQNYPNEKSLFALFATIFTHGEIVQEFATKYSSGENMKGVFFIEPGKQYTNIRSALIESGAAEPIYRRTSQVPYDFSSIFHNSRVGRLFKEVLKERMYRLTDDELTESEFYEVCYSNNFHKALSVSKDRFKSWLGGLDKQLSITQGRFIREVEISNFFSIEESTLTFEKSKEIYFLGENGDGKSLVLMATYLAFNGYFISNETDLEATGKAADILRNNRSIKLVGRDDNDFEYGPQKQTYLNNLFAYGTHRGRYSTDNPELYGFMSLFDSEQTLINPVSWLKDQKLLELEKNFDNANAFAEDKNLPISYPVEFLEKVFYDLLEKNVEIQIDGSGVSFREKGTILSFDQLSEGYKSILIFVSDLLFRLSKITENTANPMQTKAVVMVDEIDLHLHPKWQRVVIGKLRKLFPNIQFFFTTHSPTIIQGASDDAIIFRVYRNKEDGKTRISDVYYRKNLNHLMINTILTSPLFGLEDSRMSDDEESDTSETYLLYRINNKLKQELENQKQEGKAFVDDSEIDMLIQKIIKEELGGND
jgi:predicted ATPase